MFFVAGQDIYGRREHVKPADVRRILDLIDGYMNTDYEICEIRRDDSIDKNGRIDIEVQYVNKDGATIRQKLLILNDEIIDGLTFHARYKEWFGKDKQKNRRKIRCREIINA